MSRFPYWLVSDVNLTASGNGTFSYTVPQNEKLEIYSMVFKSTGIFNVIDIRDSAGQHYTNANATSEIPSVVLASGANNNNAIKDFPEPIIIEGGKIIYVDLEDTSVAANRVQMLFNCIRQN